MKFTEEKLEKAFTELLGLNRISLLHSHSQERIRKHHYHYLCKGSGILPNLNMSSFFANKLDKSTIFALQ